ncbi:hypothetical protein [Pseudoalteromonas marina]|uniref:Uncharacterized protein n=1 Tax=Pseudoalteromonas marina TaxID=267375 RepID=A0ABT9FGE0_9GAMM|nr:hypothetical protein [Pseudoalteromonas marina]MDP2565853.1 hypothetical protein [Pseudoalteromonas marina]
MKVLSLTDQQKQDLAVLAGLQKQKKRASGKLGGKSVGSGRRNEVGEDVSLPLRVPKSLIVSVKALIQLSRGKASCSELSMLCVMASVCLVAKRSLSTLPVMEIEIRPIKMYLDLLLNHFISIQPDYGDVGWLSELIDALEHYITVVEDTFSSESLSYFVLDNWAFIETVESVAKKTNYRFS